MGAKSKHFLDTSILRPLIASTEHAKNYYESSLPGERYISRYIEMEYNRGFIINLMQFYGLFSLPTVKGYGEALTLWQHNFHSRAVKAVGTVTGDIMTKLMGSPFATDLINDRTLQETHLYHYIYRLKHKTDKYKRTGHDETLCARTKHKLSWLPSNANFTFIEYIEKFNDATNAKKCGMDTFLNKNKSKVDEILKYAPPTLNKGFNSIKSTLINLKIDNKKLSCTKCSKIGDAVITLLTPDEFVLEHTDNSFDELSLILSKKHRKLPSETALSKSTH